MQKDEIAGILKEIGVFLELKGENPFKTRAYQNGARTLEGLAEPLEVLIEDGFFIAKCFRGGAERSVLEILQANFTMVRHVKPAASRQESGKISEYAMGARITGDQATSEGRS